MTTERHAGSSPSPAPASDGWRASVPELAIASVLVAAVASAAYAWAGAPVAILTLSCAAVAALALLRSLPESDPQPEPPGGEWAEPGRASIAGFYRKRGMVRDATASMASFEHELQPTLQRLLAARLAERHGVNLYTDPDAARRLLLPRARDQDLWIWLDPQRPSAPGQGGGIPPRTLAAVLDRLEQL